MRPRAQLWRPAPPARPEDLRRGPAKVHGSLQGRPGAGVWGRSWGLGARRGGGGGGGREAAARPSPEAGQVQGSSRVAPG